MSIQAPDREPDEDTGNECEDTHHAVVPNKQRVRGEGCQAIVSVFLYSGLGSSTLNVQTKASPRADEMADMNKKRAITSDFMFWGALVKAYSRPVIEAKISLNAMKTYLVSKDSVNLVPLLLWNQPLTLQSGSTRSKAIHWEGRTELLGYHKDWSCRCNVGRQQPKS